MSAEDIEQIKQLKARYFRAIDTKDWKSLAEIFTADATMDMSEKTGKPEDAQKDISNGVETIVGVIKNGIGSANTVHHGQMPEITLTSENEASGIWTMHDIVDFGKEAEFRGIRGYGHYFETYKKSDEGEWRIHHMKLTRLRVEIIGDGDPVLFVS